MEGDVLKSLGNETGEVADKQMKEVKRVKWIPPKEGHLKLNTDGSSRYEREISAAAGIIRDYKGNWIRGFSCVLGKSFSDEAELTALFYGLNMLKEMDFDKFSVEVDSTEIVRWIQGENAKRYSGMIEECRKMIRNSDDISHVYREVNASADRLCSYAIEVNAIGLQYYDKSPNDEILEKLLAEDKHQLERIHRPHRRRKKKRN